MLDGDNQNLVVYKSGVCEFVHGLPVDNSDILAVFPCAASLKPLPKNYFDEENNMKNADMPAMPIEFNGFGQYAPEAHSGLTKREMFAMHAMQSLILSLHDGAMKDHWEYQDDKVVAKQAVHYADALLEELEK